jgi:hypothetical protein
MNSVYQMSILETETASNKTQGVVLALVAAEPYDVSSPPRETETLRTLRMYNLASLINLAKWAISQRVQGPTGFDLSVLS